MNTILESVGSALMAVYGPIHDALLGSKKEGSSYYSSDVISANAKNDTANAASGEFAGPYEFKTLTAYVGGTAVVTAVIALAACGKFGKKTPMRRRRRKAAPKRTYNRRK